MDSNNIILSNATGTKFHVPIHTLGPRFATSNQNTDIILLGVAVKELAVLSVQETPEQIEKLIAEKQ